ncbi:Mur ligase [Panus rudis PR-1116 ss-1]|nr:Mur ligase [Panus rudis PR-1116 ss-1]
MSVDLSLDRISRLQAFLPPYTRPTIHIAGTNGKGSTSAILTSIFRAASPPFRVGRFNSPHLLAINDCINIDGAPVSYDVYTESRNEVQRLDTLHQTKLTDFELLTLTALFIFEQRKVDVAVVEVGMGGRLDATNIIPSECILVSVLTPVDLDHQKFLGNTVADIAKEKAGIARHGKPFVLAPQAYPETVAVVKQHVESVGGMLIEASIPTVRDWNEATDGPIPVIPDLTPSHLRKPPPQPVTIRLPCFERDLHLLLPLQGKHQLVNMGTALFAVSAIHTVSDNLGTAAYMVKSRIDVEAVRRGIQSVEWPGRLSFHTLRLPLTTPQAKEEELLVVADGAHNPASAAVLSEYIDELLSRVLSVPASNQPRRITLTYLLALSHSPPKTPLQTLSPLLPPSLSKSKEGLPNTVELKLNIACLRFTPPDGMPWVKSVPPQELRQVISSLTPEARVWTPPHTEDKPEGQLEEAFEWAYDRLQEEGESGKLGEGLVIVAGSLYLVADFYRLLCKVRMEGD